jgi:hypothetical protein
LEITLRQEGEYVYNGVATQVSTNRSKAAEKRKKVSKKAAARSTKSAKPNDAADGYEDKPVEDVVENPVDANEGVISNKKKRVAGADKRGRAFNRKGVRSECTTVH